VLSIDSGSGGFAAERADWQIDISAQTAARCGRRAAGAPALSSKCG